MDVGAKKRSVWYRRAGGSIYCVVVRDLKVKALGTTQHQTAQNKTAQNRGS